ncbi:MAG: type IVB secretion system protein IcmH/DotU [Pseudomonadota bacterium]
MSRDDPFAEPSDTERTVVNINPGGRRPPQPMAPPQAAPPAPAAPAAPAGSAGPAAAAPQMPPAGPAVDLGADATGLNPLNAAAAPLFALIGRIRNRAQHPDADALRDNVVREIQGFEGRALRAGAQQRDIQIARYAVCATIDDVVLNTPWGGRSNWTRSTMVGTFHKETVGGDRFYDLLARLEKEPATNRSLLEFIYLCLSLGFEGRLRVEDRGLEKHLAIREGLSRLIRAHRGPLETDLSQHWQGVDLPHRPLSAWLPLWTIIGITIGVLSLSWLLLSWFLAGDTERLGGQIAALRSDAAIRLERPERAARPVDAPVPDVVPLPPPPPEPDVIPQIERIRGFLAPEVEAGEVAVLDGVNAITIRVPGGAMFPSASDRLKPEFNAIVDRIAEALNEELGKVLVVGHSDSDRLRSARFQNSNVVLSLKRAEAVMDRMADKIAATDRLTAEGRGEAEPLVENSSSANKALNRRIEVVLQKTD